MFDQGKAFSESAHRMNKSNSELGFCHIEKTDCKEKNSDLSHLHLHFCGQWRPPLLVARAQRTEDPPGGVGDGTLYLVAAAGMSVAKRAA